MLIIEIDGAPKEYKIGYKAPGSGVMERKGITAEHVITKVAEAFTLKS